MTPFECPHEQDVLDALASRRWPARCDDELRDHVGSCALCADLVSVAGALLDAEEDDRAPADPPPASVVWWRAQLRAREEAARAALRPIRLTQAVATACGAALVLLALFFVLPLAWASMTGVLAHVPALDAHAAITRAVAAVPAVDTDAATQTALAALASRGVQLAFGVWLVLGPVALYLTFTND